MALLTVYLLVGIGCAAYSRMGTRRHVLGLVALALLWPLYAPFVLGAAQDSANKLPVVDDEIPSLERSATEIAKKLKEIDILLSSDDWNAQQVEARRTKLAHAQGHCELRESLRVRLDHIERLTLLRKMHSDELEAIAALLHQREAQVQLSRFIGDAETTTLPNLEELRERMQHTEDALNCETEYLSLCRES